MIKHACVLIALWTACSAIAESSSVNPQAVLPYDPLAVDEAAVMKTHDVTVHDATRDRQIPVRVYLPVTTDPAPVVLFSHGLGGSRENNPHLGTHWAKRGFVCVFLQHPGSDQSVWQDQPVNERMNAMNQAASGNNAVLRYEDVPAVLDQLALWHTDAASPLHDRLDLERIGMSGHSFGAKTTQGVIGQRFGAFGARYHDERIDAAVVFSPGAPKRRVAEAFGDIDLPVLLLTGTNDTASVGNTTVEDRFAVFPALPEGAKYELVFHEGVHSFLKPVTARTRLKGHTNPSHATNSIAFSTAFWEAYLLKDEAAKAWLNSDSAQAMLQAQDRWRFK